MFITISLLMDATQSFVLQQFCMTVPHYFQLYNTDFENKL